MLKRPGPTYERLFRQCTHAAEGALSGGASRQFRLRLEGSCDGFSGCLRVAPSPEQEIRRREDPRDVDRPIFERRVGRATDDGFWHAIDPSLDLGRPRGPEAFGGARFSQALQGRSETLGTDLAGADRDGERNADEQAEAQPKRSFAQ